MFQIQFLFVGIHWSILYSTWKCDIVSPFRKQL